VRKNPSISLVAELDSQRKHSFKLDEAGESRLTGRHQLVLLFFLLTIIVLVVGILKYQWFITEIAGLFLALGIVSGILGGLRAGEITDSFKAGAADMMGVAFIIGFARALLVVATDGKVIDTLLFVWPVSSPTSTRSSRRR